MNNGLIYQHGVGPKYSIKISKNLDNAWNQRELKWALGPLTFNLKSIAITIAKIYTHAIK